MKKGADLASRRAATVRLLGKKNPSSRRRREGWSIVEELIRWFAKEDGAEALDSPSYMVKRLQEYFAAQNQALERAGDDDAFKRSVNCKSLVSNWRNEREYVARNSWRPIMDLTGLSMETLSLAMEKKLRNDHTPIPGFVIPGPAGRPAGPKAKAWSPQASRVIAQSIATASKRVRKTDKA